MVTTPEIIGDVVTADIAFDGTNFESVSPYLKYVETKRGVSRAQTPVLRYEGGLGSATLKNNDRRFDPTNLAGPYVSGGETEILPLRPVRFRATWNSVTYGLMRGFIDKWDIVWNGPNWSEVSVPCSDAFQVLEANKRVPLATPVGDGEDSGARINRILDSISWPASLRSIATGNSPMQATDLGGSALAECLLTAESELGEFYINGDGNAVFRNRHAIITESRSNTVQATFGDGPGELPYAKDGLSISYDHETLANSATIGRKDGEPQSYSDAASISKFRTKTYNKTDLMLRSDAEALNFAQWLVSLAKDPELRFDSIRINPLRDPDALFPHVLGREIGDRIRIIRRPPGGGDSIEREVFIRGIQHVITESTWMTTWTLQSASSFGEYFTLDDPVLGLLNNNIPLVF